MAALATGLLVAALPLHAAESLSCAAAQSADPLQLALPALQAEHERADNEGAKLRSAARLGEAYLRLNRLGEAEALLELAAGAATLPPRERASALLDLGSLRLARRQPAAAEAAWAQAVALAGSDPANADLALAAELNRIRVAPIEQRLIRLQAAEPRLAGLADSATRARHAINLGHQARELPGGAALAYRGFDQGRVQALAARDDRLAAEAFDGLAALYEDERRDAEALQLAEQAIAHARKPLAHDLLMNLEARAGRIARRLGLEQLALDAHRRAVEHIEAVRNDIPVVYEDGRSSFRQTLEPTYLGLTDLLLRRAAVLEGEPRQAVLRQARDTVELIKQTELEDYLRDRCSVGSARNRGASYRPPAGTAIYYPIILPDRLELLLETQRGIERVRVDIAGEALREQVLDFVAALRAGNPLRARAEAMYRYLVAPLDALLASERITTLVTVPDGVLRLLPMASLHDGRGYLIERLAVANVPGLSLIPEAPRERQAPRALLAGMSEPGPVVDKLSQQVVDTVLDPSVAARNVRGAARSTALRDALALPGVKQEIDGIAKLVPGTVLLDSRFTLEALKAQLRDSDPAIVHIASHGVFGDSADSTFIMTYDELLTLDGLQALLRGERARRTPIELLTLSACQTAEGDDRAPLGMSGTALKARARSALGTLWPVADDAANEVMSSFYKRLAADPEGKRGSRVEALRQAQLELLAKPSRRHPFYWAPFILIGDWQ